MRLHIGCGPRILEGWVNLDIYPLDGSIQCDVRNGIPYGDGEAESIYAEDFFEHLGQRDQIRFLAECYRVLRHKGVCRLTMPELLYSLEGSEYHRGAEGVVEMWHSGHLLVPTKEYIAAIAKTIGFVVMFNSRNQSLWKYMPEDLRPHHPRPDKGNLFVDLVKDTP